MPEILQQIELVCPLTFFLLLSNLRASFFFLLIFVALFEALLVHTKDRSANLEILDRSPRSHQPSKFHLLDTVARHADWRIADAAYAAAAQVGGLAAKGQTAMQEQIITGWQQLSTRVRESSRHPAFPLSVTHTTSSG
eukprot:1909747-Rhodomonas_salina.3